MSDTSITAILASLGSKLAIPKINDSIKKLTTGKITSEGQNAGLQSLSNTLKARSNSWRAAASTLDKQLMPISSRSILNKLLLSLKD